MVQAAQMVSGLGAALNSVSEDFSGGQVLSGTATVVGPIIVPGQQASSTVTTAPFGDLLTEAIGQVELLEQQARSSVEGLMSGTGIDLHEAMIATQKAEMGFELALSVRNKALAAYQQVMAMQF
jgi:flagellar hook-basal body complex protein FliE